MLNKDMECLEFMESSEFKAIDILRNIRDDSSVRFLDETLDEAYYFKRCCEVDEQLAQYDLIIESEED